MRSTRRFGNKVHQSGESVCESRRGERVCEPRRGEGFASLAVEKGRSDASLKQRGETRNNLGI